MDLVVLREYSRENTDYHLILHYAIFDISSVKPVLSGHSPKPKIGFQDQILLNAGHKYCRMLQGEHFAILLTFIKLPFVIKIFVLSIFEWSLKKGFTVFAFDIPINLM